MTKQKAAPGRRFLSFNGRKFGSDRVELCREGVDDLPGGRTDVAAKGLRLVGDLEGRELAVEHVRAGEEVIAPGVEPLEQELAAAVQVKDTQVGSPLAKAVTVAALERRAADDQ